MDLPMNDNERSELITFIYTQFKDLPKKTLAEFKNRNPLPGKGQISDYIDYTTLLLYARTSAKAAYQYYKDYNMDVGLPMAANIVDQALVTIQKRIIEKFNTCENPIVGNLINVLRFANIEQNAQLLVSEKIAKNLQNSKNFVVNETKTDNEDIIHKIGRWKNVSIYIHPNLDINDSTVYLIHDTIIDYRIVEIEDVELLKVEDVNTDYEVTFSPALLQLKFSPDDTYKVFKIKKLLYE